MIGQGRRDILAVGAIVLGLVAMYFVSSHSAVAPPQSQDSASAADSDQDDDAGSHSQQSQVVPFTLVSEASAPIAPDFSLTSMDGQKFTLSEAVKRGPVLIDFWATWCGPCKYELPHLWEMYNDYKSRGVQIYTINVDANSQQLHHFFSIVHAGCPVLVDTGGRTQSLYQVTALPSLFLIDKQMRVRSSLEGADTNTKEDLGRSLDQLLQGA